MFLVKNFFSEIRFLLYDSIKRYICGFDIKFISFSINIIYYNSRLNIRNVNTKIVLHHSSQEEFPSIKINDIV